MSGNWIERARENEPITDKQPAAQPDAPSASEYNKSLEVIILQRDLAKMTTRAETAESALKREGRLLPIIAELIVNAKGFVDWTQFKAHNAVCPACKKTSSAGHTSDCSVKSLLSELDNALALLTVAAEPPK